MAMKILIQILVLILCTYGIDGARRSSSVGEVITTFKNVKNVTTDIFKDAEDVVCDNKTMHRLDALASQFITVSEKNRRFPETAAQLRAFCNEGLRYTGLIKGFIKNCLNHFFQNLVKLFYVPAMNEFNSICRPGRLSKKAKELLKAARCGNAAKKGLNRCNQKFIDVLLGIPKEKEQRLRIPMACCHSHELRECLKSEAEEVKLCTKHTIDYVERYAMQTFGAYFEFGCLEYKEPSDRCDKLIARTPKKDPNQKRPKSIFLPLMGIMASFDDFEGYFNQTYLSK